MKIFNFVVATFCLITAITEFYLWCIGQPITGVTHRLTVAFFASCVFMDAMAGD